MLPSGSGSALTIIIAPLPILNQQSIVPRVEPTRGCPSSRTGNLPPAFAMKDCWVRVGNDRRAVIELPRHVAAFAVTVEVGVPWVASM